METEEDIHLADAEVCDALNRGDKLGRLVTRAFSFSVPPFGEIRGEFASDERKGGNA